MRISRNWLEDYVDLSGLSDEDFCSIITTKVAEVDDIEQVGVELERAVVAEILEAKPHPERSKLKIAKIQLDGEQVQVVCGAPNCEAGMRTAWLDVGTKDFAGVVSRGMLASESELGISSDNSGILCDSILSTASPGDRLVKYCGKADTVLEIDNKSLTHRPDLWSQYGFARELSAILGKPLLQNPDRFADCDAEGSSLLKKLSTGAAPYKIEIYEKTGVPRFAALLIENIKVESSPLWLRRRLFAVDLGVRNILVDLSNYTMMDVGQPNHTYDADKLVGNTIAIRNASEKEKFLGLDDIERELSSEDVVIADRDSAIALGGVIGGGPSAISDSTSRVLLESANFDPVRIRVTSKRHQIRTDASNRFEKGRTPYSVPLSLHRFVELLSGVQSDISLKGEVCDSFIDKPKQVFIGTNAGFIEKRLGHPVGSEKIEKILTSLQFVIDTRQKDWQVEVPYFRATRDIGIAEDLVEEVGRIFGYENIPERVPLIESSASGSDAIKGLSYQLQDLLRGNGFSEAQLYSFMRPEFSASLGFAADRYIKLANPVADGADTLRTSLIPGLLECAGRNSRFEDRVMLFEIGRAYAAKAKKGSSDGQSPEVENEGPVEERRLLGLAYASGLEESSVANSMQPAISKGNNFYSLVGLIKKIANLLRTESVNFVPCASPETWMHPYRHAEILLGDTRVGVIAEVVPGMIEQMPERLVLAELDLGALESLRPAVSLFEAISKYPDSFFELSVVMPKEHSYSGLSAMFDKLEYSDMIRSKEVLAVYEGSPLAEGEKSISIKFNLGAKDRTLGSDELSKIQEAFVKRVENSEYRLRT